MSANLFGERYIGRVTAWHKLGTVFDEELSMSEAVRRAGLDYEVRLEQLYAKVMPQLADGLFETNPRKAIQLPITDRFAIVRDPTPDDPLHQVFGVVSHKYEIIQNYRIAEILDQIIDIWPVETAGALGMGETTFFTLRVNGPTDIAGDPIEEFFVISDEKTGKSALKVAFTPVRVVCQNTLTAAMGSAKVLSFMSHTDDVENKLKSRVSVLKELESMREATKQNFHRLAEAILDDDEIDQVFEVAYPVPTKPASLQAIEDMPDDVDLLEGLFQKASKVEQRWFYYKDRALRMREDAKRELVRINDEEMADLPHLKNSAWAAWQAITAKEDHRDGPEGMYASALFGERAKTKVRAYKKAYALAMSK